MYEKIRTRYYDPIFDARGIKLKVDDAVVFNRSGELVLGVVKEMKVTKTMAVPYGIGFHNSYLIKIDAVDGKLSKVTNPKGIIIYYRKAESEGDDGIRL